MGRNKGNFEQEILEFYTSSFASFVTRVWFKIRTAQNAKCFAAVQTQPRRLNIYKSDKTFYNTLWFCIIKSLKSLQNVLKLPKITPEVPKSMNLGHIFFLGLAKQIIFIVPFPSPNLGKPSIRRMAFRSPFFVSKVKKTYQWSQLGKINPKKLSEYGFN